MTNQNIILDIEFSGAAEAHTDVDVKEACNDARRYADENGLDIQSEASKFAAYCNGDAEDEGRWNEIEYAATKRFGGDNVALVIR